MGSAPHNAVQSACVPEAATCVSQELTCSCGQICKLCPFMNSVRFLSFIFLPEIRPNILRNLGLDLALEALLLPLLNHETFI